MVARVGGPAGVPDGGRDLARRDTPARRGRATHAGELVRGQARRCRGGASVGHEGDATAGRLTRPRRRASRRCPGGRAGRRPTASASRRPAGPRASRSVPVGGAEPALRRRCRVGGPVRRRPPRRDAGSRARPASVSTNVPGHGSVRADLARELGGRPRRVEAAVLAAQRPGQRRAVGRLGRSRGARRRSHGPSDRSSRSAATSARRASSRASSRSRRGRPARLRDDRPGVETRVHPHQRDPGLGVAGQDRRRDRRRPAMARQQRRVEVQRAVRRARGAAPGRSGRSRRGPASAGRAPGPPRSPRARGAAPGVRIVGMPSAAAASCDRRVAVGALPAPAGRGGAVTTPTRSDAPDARPAVGGSARRTRRCRGRRCGPDAVRPSGHARALVASRTSASSSSPCPTAISSSIESR